MLGGYLWCASMKGSPYFLAAAAGKRLSDSESLKENVSRFVLKASTRVPPAHRSTSFAACRRNRLCHKGDECAKKKELP